MVISFQYRMWLGLNVLESMPFMIRFFFLLIADFRLRTSFIVCADFKFRSCWSCAMETLSASNCSFSIRVDRKRAFGILGSGGSGLPL